MGGSSATIGYWYKLAYHHGLCKGPIDAFLEYRGGKKVAWSGSLTASATLSIDQPQLWGGEKDQGGIVGPLNAMFGEAGQMPNAYLQGVFGNQTAAWRGMTTVAFEGGKFGAMNPYPQQPSYKVRSITKQWDDGACWYEAKAIVHLSGSAIAPEDADFGSVSISGEVGGFYDAGIGGTFTPAGDLAGYSFAGDFDVGSKPHLARLQLKIVSSGEVLADTGWYGVEEKSLSGSLLDASRMDLLDVIGDASGAPATPLPTLTGGVALQVQTFIVAEAGYYLPQARPRFRVFKPGSDDTRLAMNPAHMLVYSHTQRDTSRESIETISSASAEAAADWFFDQGFGLCTARRPEAESPAEFRRRIEKVAACSFTRSLADGLFYIDIANGVYDFGSLPILTDDDVLDFKEIPTVLDNAINSVSVKYFDPVRKESVITPPVRALGLIAEFGVIHQTYDYPEIPTGEIAVRVAHRELLASTTPTRAFDLATTRKPYGWRQNTYFRAQLPKRGIADMVCLVGDLQHGSLKSGAIKLAAVQDVYSLPATVYTEVEHGVDTRPDQTPSAIVQRRAFEAPYVNIVAVLSRTELAALPDDVGYLVAVAGSESGDIDFDLLVAPAGASSYADQATGEWCATAILDAAGKTETVVPFTAGTRMSQVLVGMAALWHDEILRVDAIDQIGGTITFGRGCADTVPATHAAGSPVYIYGVGAAVDTTEYTDGETVSVKLLSNTGSQRLALGLAPSQAVTFDQRQVRPYAPGDLRITDAITTDASYPASCEGLLAVEWAHRDRVLQANLLVDASMASIGPEAGTTYTVRYYLGGVLDSTEAGITGTVATPYTMSGDGLVRVEVQAIRGGIVSWQSATAEFNYSVVGFDIYGDQSGNTYADESGNNYGA